MTTTSVARPSDRPWLRPETLRTRMDQRSLNLRGCAAAFRALEERFQNTDHDAASMLALLARDVDLEADAMGEAEAYLNSLARRAA
jgi:hypothetical protein